MIRLDHVSRDFRHFVVHDISLEVATGEYLVIVGPTGAGKTLLLELLLGIHHPDHGRITVGDVDVTDLSPERRGIGMVYQDYALFPHLDVLHNLAFGLRYHGVPRRQRRQVVQDTAQLLGIDHLLHRYPGTLSGGEQQRVAIGRALVTKPRVLLLDEPFSALDRQTTSRLRHEIKALHTSQGLTVLHVSHDLIDAREAGGRIALIHEGRVHGVGTAEQLLRRPGTRFAAEFFGAVNLFAGEVTAAGDRWRIVAGPIVATSDVPPNGAGAHLLVHADEIVLRAAATATTIDGVAAEIVGLRDAGTHVAVQLRLAGLDDLLTAFVTRHAAREQSLQLGSRVTVDLQNAVHVIHD